MSSINKAVFQIIGFFAIITSVAFLAINVSKISQTNTTERFIYQVTDLAINCIGIYGGFQLVKLRKSGQKLLVVWLLCRIFTAILVTLMLITNLFFSGNNQFTASIPILFPLTTAYYIFSPIALVYLLPNKARDELLAEQNPHHTQMALRLLSLLMPGLSRALVDNLLIGMILFYVYSVFMLYGRFDGTSELQLGTFYLAFSENLCGKIIVWIIFVGLDWKMIKKHGQERLMPSSKIEDG